MRQDRIRKAKPLLIQSDIPAIFPLVLHQVQRRGEAAVSGLAYSLGLQLAERFG